MCVQVCNIIYRFTCVVFVCNELVMAPRHENQINEMSLSHFIFEFHIRYKWKKKKRQKNSHRRRRLMDMCRRYPVATLHRIPYFHALIVCTLIDIPRRMTECGENEKKTKKMKQMTHWSSNGSLFHFEISNWLQIISYENFISNFALNSITKWKTNRIFIAIEMIL